MEVPPDLEQYALDQIRDYITRKFKGHGLARLGGAVLEVQGYRVQISPEGANGGMDIIAGYGLMDFDHPVLVVQVKPGDTPVDVKAVRELQRVMKSFGADHGFIVVGADTKALFPRRPPDSSSNSGSGPPMIWLELCYPSTKGFRKHFRQSSH